MTRPQTAFPILKTVLAASALLCLGFTPDAYAAAKQPVADTQKMTYEVYAGGINAMTAELEVALLPHERYSLDIAAYTTGFLAKLAPWKGTFETKGWQKKNGVDQPEVHRSTATWRDEVEVKEYTYDRNGNFTGYSIKDPENDGKKQELDKDLVQGTTDVLTATLHAMKVIGAGGNCAGTTEIFDGKRRFELTFKFDDYEDLKATRYNVYQGPSQRCIVEVKPGAGEWHSKPRGWLSIQEQGRQRGSLPTVWFAQVEPGSPAVPVKIRVKTEYGGMFMHLVNYANDGKVKTADIVKSN